MKKENSEVEANNQEAKNIFKISFVMLFVSFIVIVVSTYY